MPAENKSDHPNLAPRFLALMITGLIGTGLAAAVRPALATENRSDSIALMRLVQDTSLPPDDTDVPPQEVDKYIKVYQAMQHNRNLTVDQAAAQQGLSLTDFRNIENRIQRNDALQQHVKESLRPQASPTAAK